MANVNAPDGFQYFGRLDGSAPTVGNTVAYLASDNQNPIGYGDPVIPLNTGFIDIATASSVPMFGIFFGCTYFSPAVGRVIWSRNWPGSGNSGTVKCYIENDPQSLFVVQSDGTAPITFADINTNAQLVAGTPNALSGFSTAMVSHTAAETNTYPFRIVGLLSQYSPPNSVNGTDDTAAYNRVIVAGNFWTRASLTGI